MSALITIFARRCGSARIFDHHSSGGANLCAAELDESITIQGSFDEMCALIDELHDQIHDIAEARAVTLGAETIIAAARPVEVDGGGEES